MPGALLNKLVFAIMRHDIACYVYVGLLVLCLYASIYFNNGGLVIIITISFVLLP